GRCAGRSARPAARGSRPWSPSWPWTWSIGTWRPRRRSTAVASGPTTPAGASPWSRRCTTADRSSSPRSKGSATPSRPRARSRRGRRSSGGTPRPASSSAGRTAAGMAPSSRPPRRRPRHAEVSATPAAAGKSSIGLWAAVSIGIGGMIGAGIFSILGGVAPGPGPALPVSFVVGGIVALLATYSYAKLGARYPTAGGAVQFLVEGLGDNVLSGGINTFQWIGYVITLALYASGFAGYAKTFLPDGTP